MTITFRLQTPSGPATATVSGVVSWTQNGPTVTLHRIHGLLSDNGRPTTIRWTETYSNVLDRPIAKEKV